MTVVALVVTVVLVRRYGWDLTGTMLTVLTPALTVTLLTYGTPLVLPSRPSPPPGGDPAGPAARREQGSPVGVVPARNRLFTGRAELLARIGRGLTGGPVAVTALHGMGGVGKTQLAAEYAHRHTSDYTLIWWIDAEQTDLIGEKIAALAGPLGLPTDTPVPDTAAAVLTTLAHRRRWLLVFDNAENPEALHRWLPTGGGHVLITSRNPGWDHLAATVEVDLLPRAESINLLTTRVPDLDPALADALADELGDLPLALAQAGAYLHRTRVPPDQYLRQFQTRRREYLGKGDPPLYAGRLDTCWSISLQRLRTDAPAAITLLQMCALLAPDPIPLTVFPTHIPHLTPVKTRTHRWRRLWPWSWGSRSQPGDSIDEAVAAAVDYSLLRRTGDTVTLHRLLQAVIAGQLTPDQHQHLTATTTRLLTTAAPTDMLDPATWPVWTALGPHLLHAHTHLTGPDDPHHLRQAVNQFCSQLYARGDYTAAYALATRLHHEASHHLGLDHPDTLNIANTLIGILNALGHHTAARDLGARCLVLMRLAFDDYHPSTLTSAANLANAHRALGDHEQAQLLDKLLFDRSCRLFGGDHPNTLRSATSLASTFTALGQHEQARQLDEDTLARRRRVLGSDHPDTLTSAHNLALRLSALGEHQTAWELAEDTLARQRRVLGNDHPHTQQTAQFLQTFPTDRR